MTRIVIELDMDIDHTPSPGEIMEHLTALYDDHQLDYEVIN